MTRNDQPCFNGPGHGDSLGNDQPLFEGQKETPGISFCLRLCR